ncbi:MAG: hypothetical protein ACI8XZ_005599, partial [Gammaproteobacteria bacterium]
MKWWAFVAFGEPQSCRLSFDINKIEFLVFGHCALDPR